MNENKKAIDMTPEELNEWLASLPAPENDAPCLPFSDPDPYFKYASREQAQSRLFNKDRHLTVRNYCAMALPKLPLHSVPVEPSIVSLAAMTEIAVCPQSYSTAWLRITKIKKNIFNERWKNSRMCDMLIYKQFCIGRLPAD